MSISQHAQTKILAGFLVILLTVIHTGCALTAHAVGLPSGGTTSWANPNAKTLRQVGPAPTEQHESSLYGNLDCVSVTYRLVGTSSMQTGCFTETAFGLMDSDTGVVIFGDTDEGTPILHYSPNQLIAPWPKAMDLLSLDSVATGGMRLSLYKNPMAVMQDKLGLNLLLAGKQLVAPAELTIKDPHGVALVINPQSLAFSRGGSWLVAETLNGSFVRINLASLEVLPFAQAFGSQGGNTFSKSRVSITEDGRFVAIANDSAQVFRIYDLATCYGAEPGQNLELSPQNCASFDYWPFIQGQIGSLKSTRHIRYINDGLLSIEIQKTSTDPSQVYELAPSDRISSLINYLALGDSYTSGEGVFDYIRGTDTGYNRCHLSARSYPLLLTSDLFGNTGGHSVACSGAVIRDIASTSDNYRGQAKDAVSFGSLGQDALLSVMSNYLPGYIAQQRFVSEYQPAVETVSIGGNDIGFGDMLERCAIYHVSLHVSDNTCFNTYEDRVEIINAVDRTIPKLVTLYKQLQSEAPLTKQYVIGYPQIIDDQGNCAANVHFNKSELEFSVEIINYLDGAIQKAASQAGLAYVDVSKALYGHRLCEARSYNIAVNGLTAGDDSGPLGHESYHPNTLGHMLIEQAILQQTKNFTISTSSSQEISSSKLSQAPRSGRPVNTWIPSGNLTARLVKAGSSIPIQVPAEGNIKPYTDYAVKLDGSGGAILGTVSGGSTGNIDTSITLPSTTMPGEHTIDVTGPDQAGNSIDISQPVYVPVKDNDYDGDLRDNDVDSCPYSVNSGLDTDEDGTDDSCDTVIGEPLSSREKKRIEYVSLARLLLNQAPNLAVQGASKSSITPRLRAGLVKSPIAESQRRIIAKDQPVRISWIPWIAVPVLAWWILSLSVLASKWLCGHANKNKCQR